MSPTPRVVACFDWEAHYAKQGLTFSPVVREVARVEEEAPRVADSECITVADGSSCSDMPSPSHAPRTARRWPRRALAFGVATVASGAWFGSEHVVMALQSRDVALPRPAIAQADTSFSSPDRLGFVAPPAILPTSANDPIERLPHRDEIAEILKFPATKMAPHAVTNPIAVAELPQPLQPATTRQPPSALVEDVAPVAPAPRPKIVIRPAPAPEAPKAADPSQETGEQKAAMMPRFRLIAPMNATSPANAIAPTRTVEPTTAITPERSVVSKREGTASRARLDIGDPDAVPGDRRVAVRDGASTHINRAGGGNGGAGPRGIRRNGAISEEASAAVAVRDAAPARKRVTATVQARKTHVSERMKPRGRHSYSDGSPIEYVTVFGARVRKGNPEWAKDIAAFNYSRN